MKKLIISLFIMALVISLSGAAYGATTTGILDVSANVVPVCTVSTTAVSFGSYDGTAAVLENGDVTVNCATGTLYNIALDAGLNFAGGWRNISDGVNFISYALYKDTIATEWGDFDFANTYTTGSSVGDTGAGTSQPHIVYGKLFGAVLGPTGPYTDVVTVTVHY
jgi:spore coat protein U-like protein